MSEAMELNTGRRVNAGDMVLEHPMWKNPRSITGLAEKELIEFGEDIVERGQIVNCIVQRVKADNDQGFVELTLDGQRRVRGVLAYLKSKKKSAKDFQFKVVDLYPEVLELTEESSDRMLLDIIAAAVKRAPIGSYEQTEAAMLLINRNEMSLKQIGDAIGRSESWVSRMVKARRLASDKLLKEWAQGKLTDEQFKDLADIQGHDHQNAALEEAKEMAKSGRSGKAEARNALKEKAAKAKAEKKAKAADKPKSKKAAKRAEKKAKAAKANPDTLLSKKPQLSELVALTEIKKPTDPYVLGLMHGAQIGMGKMSVDDLKPAFRTYLKAIMKDQKAKAEAEADTTAN